jgi:DNA mismatch repair ATPase MutS
MYSLNRPEIVADSAILQIEDGRHLLVELFSNRPCIANDCNLNGDQTKMVITGANSSGKSVYLKQVGIITFLAHIGR